jgi:hypothetical protein
MNILDKNDCSVKSLFGDKDNTKPKREIYKWNSESDPGVFKLIKKELLNIDGEYQREKTSQMRIIEIARDWDWKLIGAISVVLRDDGSYWVYDGGHRTRASFMRDDVFSLPCMVFKVASKKYEAKAFYGANKMKKNVSSIDSFKAALVAEEPDSVAINNLIDRYGYRVSDNDSKFNFRGVNTLKILFSRNEILASNSFGFLADIACGDVIPCSILRGIFTLSYKLRGKYDILNESLKEKISSIGLKNVEILINREKILVGKGGELVEARAILNIINKGKHTKIKFNEAD